MPADPGLIALVSIVLCASAALWLMAFGRAGAAVVVASGASAATLALLGAYRSPGVDLRISAFEPIAGATDFGSATAILDRLPTEWAVLLACAAFFAAGALFGIWLSGVSAADDLQAPHPIPRTDET